MANEFDDWRSKYDTMSSSEQVEYYNEIEELYPEQAHYNYENVKINSIILKIKSLYQTKKSFFLYILGFFYLFNLAY